MKETLQLLFKKSLKVNPECYTETQMQDSWLGNPPASIEQITTAEKRLNLKFPNDYIEVLLLANGFPSPSETNEPAFDRVEEVDYYRNFEYNVISSWKETDESSGLIAHLERALMVGGKQEEQQFLLIPPGANNTTWEYWHFALWNPGVERFENLTDYFSSVITFLENLDIS
jgi:cell wall assembly regulator SMI1